ncbi:MAG: hypothetical protein ABS63_06435 [Microbacterium sp. SCN 70-27]|uniref:Ig-like domain-containing protein n=1 Tax=unclassified Microbacterium TaxID=2609290 RepID=UPI00086A9F0F|nr:MULTISPECIES: Ig-like domain-containing protein [unclassified Microbacterium]MBN9224032.1 tandem-95 repeat protein [Microbacterium sp.]ODT27930.1 MAG: hypothetical protein ABS63_06435 [Microbacterium sp. SCN 70-27]
MALFGSIRRHRLTLASAGVLATTAAVVSTLATIFPGVPTADLELDDGGIWVTKSSDLLVGHLNHPARVLDGAVRTRSAEFDVLQAGGDVIVHDEATGAITPVDPAAVSFGSDVAAPAGATVALGGAGDARGAGATRSSTVAVLAAGDVFVAPFAQLGSMTFAEDTATASVGDGGAVTVSRDGSRVFAVSRGDSQVISLDATGAKTGADPLAKLPSDAEVQITAVGETPVVFDAAAGTAYIGTSAIAVPDGTGGRLQTASDGGDAAYVSTARALVRVPLDGSAPETVQTVAEGAPGAPMVLGGCAYSVWSGSGAFVRDCAGTSADQSLTITGVAASSRLVLRANHRAVVVNDTVGGTVWVVADQAIRVDNWDDVIPPPDNSGDEEKSQEDTPQNVLPERSAENHPPVAKDDEYGVRPGRTTVLRVTENDTDPDGDLLSARLDGAAPSGYDIVPVLGGAALQIAVPSTASGQVSFRYIVDDGRDATASATVTVTVHDPSVNEPPRQRKVNSLQVEAGASSTYGALEGWEDPDGDDIYLSQATVEGGDTIVSRANGVIDYTAASGQTGLKDVTLVVSDGREQTTGKLRVDVRPKDALPPVANADRATAIAGIPLTVYPLVNDLSPTAEKPQLKKTDVPMGATVTPDYAAGTFDFLAAAPGTYYVQYLITVGTNSAAGMVRIDVLPADATGAAPVAVRDMALLPTGRSTLVDVLANDSDPGGNVLVLQSATIAPGSPVSVEVIEHAIIRVTDLSGLAAPLTFTYVVSNGAQTATGEVTVTPIKLPEKLRPPVAVPDEAVVRAGDVVSIPVLANDYHPDGDAFTLLPELVDTDLPDPTAVWVDGDRLRLQAPTEPGTYSVQYQIMDSQVQKAAARVRIQVSPSEGAANVAPRPKPVTARTVAGTTVRIPIPLEGIDPDGDSVELVGLASNPAKGRVTTGDAWLTYEAYPDASGRDTFTYTVRDRMGATAVGTVTVGVAAPGVENQAPYAVKDVAQVRPGRRVAVPVLVNDSDPDGDEISLVADGLTSPEGVSGAKVAGGRVVVTAPEQPGDYTFTYTIVDTYGATAQGSLLLQVSSDAALQAPVARDDRVTAAMVDSRLKVEMSVLQNDEDPDGTTDDLKVAVVAGDATVTPDAKVSVTVGPTAQIVRYSLTDMDGLTAQAFVFVPGLDNLRPVLSDSEPIEVVSGQTVAIELADRVRVRPGHAPRVSTVESVKAAHSNGAALVQDEDTLAYTSAEGYFGADTLGVMVTDGTGPDDAEGLSSYITIPLVVLPSSNQPPTLKNASVTVAPQEDPATIDLRRLAYDPDKGDLEKLAFQLDGTVPSGYEASIDGSVLKVSAGGGVKVGDVQTLTVTAADGSATSQPATVAVKVVSSRRPLAVANDDVIDRADQGKTQRVDVLANDSNPFPERGALTVLSARVDTGRGTAEVEGGTVVVTPASDFFGTMIVAYRIADATGAADREVEGRIRLTVQGKPEAPGTPTVGAISDRTVVLTWGTPSNNGAEITGYTVTSQNGYSKKCPATTCTLDGLTNDVEYIFRVVATNVVGDSEPSGPSASARPDQRPDAPVAPTLVFGDRQLQVAWTAPRSTGSPVLSYELEISPSPDAGPSRMTGVTGTSLTWSGLQNGVPYQVRVRALNRAPEPSDFGMWSTPMIPAAAPDAPGQPVAQYAPSVGQQAQITVDWAAPQNVNGDAVDTYTVTATGGDGGARSQTVSGTNAVFTVGTSTAGYSFSVTAHNKAGNSASSPASAPVRATNAPDAPASVTIAETGAAGQLRVTITPGSWNGNSPGEVSWRWSGTNSGAIQVESQSASSVVGLINGAANGQMQSVEVWGVSGVSGKDGGHTTSNQASPYGPVNQPGASASQNGQSVLLSWTAPAANGRPIDRLEISINGGGWENVGPNSGSRAVGDGYSQSHSIRVRAFDTVGQISAEATAGARTVDPPARTWVTQAGSTVTFHWENLPPNSFSSSYTLRFWAYGRDQHPGSFASDYCGPSAEASAPTANLSASSGAFSFTCTRGAGAGGYSVEPYGSGGFYLVHLNVGESKTY